MGEEQKPIKTGEIPDEKQDLNPDGTPVKPPSAGIEIDVHDEEPPAPIVSVRKKDE